MRGDPVTTRARHWTRWRRRRLDEGWRRAAQLDVLGSEARTAWVCSWQRSGSTLLAEVLASAAGTRLVYEPANLPGRLFTGEDAAAVALPTGPGPELGAIERALRGRVHGAWVDQLARRQLVRRRVVKDVRAMGLLGVIAARHPATPIVVLVRHPLAVARSVVELGWATGGDADELLVAEARRWAAAHASALSTPAARRALVVTYEHLVLEGDATLDLVLTHLGGHHATWRDLRVDRARLDEPSATSFRRSGTRSGREWIGTFDDVAPRVVDDVASVLADAGLGDLYGRSPEPLVGPRGVAGSLRRH